MGDPCAAHQAQLQAEPGVREDGYWRDSDARQGLREVPEGKQGPPRRLITGKPLRGLRLVNRVRR